MVTMWRVALVKSHRVGAMSGVGAEIWRVRTMGGSFAKDRHFNQVKRSIPCPYG